MEGIHKTLKNRFDWYDRWHNHPRHHHAHWFGLFAFLLLMTSFISAQVVFLYADRLEAQAQTTLPAPNHQMMLGYYHVLAQYGDFLNDVSGYTNTQIILQNSFLRADGTNDIAGFNNAFSRSITASDTIIFAPEFSPTTELDRGLEAARPFWNNINYILLADEPSWNKATTESNIDSFKNLVTSKGLPQKEIIINYTHNGIMTIDGFQASNLDVVSFEAYFDCSTTACPDQNDPNLIATLNSRIDQAKARIGARRMIILVQGYNRNGLWTNLNSLQSVQTLPYLKANVDPNVIGVFLFSYARPGGSRDLGDCIKNEHRKIWGAISGTSQPASATCGGGTGSINFAPILSSWVPTQNLRGDGWYPELSPDGRYVTFGNENTYITDLQTKIERMITPAGETRCWGGYWIRPTTITFVCESFRRYEASLSDNWAPVLMPDDSSLIDSNLFHAADGHWATFATIDRAGRRMRLARDNSVLATGTGGLAGVTGNFTVAACDNSNTTLCVWDDTQLTHTFTPQFGFNFAGVGMSDYIYYGNPTLNRGICISDGKDIDLSAVAGGEGVGPIFSVNGEPWIAGFSATQGYMTVLRPWGQRNSIITDDGGIYASVVHNNGIFTIAFNGDRGQLRVITVSDTSPTNDISGGIPPETCGSGAIITPTPDPTPTPTPAPCEPGIVRPGVPIICSFAPTVARPGDTIAVKGGNLSNTVQLISTDGNRYTVLGTVDATGENVTFDIPSDILAEMSYTLSVIGSDGVTLATSSQLLFITLNTDVAPAGEAGPFGQPSGITPPGSTATFGFLIGSSLTYAVYALGIAVFIMILYAGFLWMTSAANPGNIALAKRYITNAIIGAVLLLSSYIILYTINPDLVGGTLELPGISKPTGTQGTIVQPTCNNSVCSNNSSKACTQNSNCNVICVNNVCNNGASVACTLDTDCQIAPRFLTTNESESAMAFSAGCSGLINSGYQDFSAVECPGSMPLSLDPTLQLQDTNANQQVGATAVQGGGNNGAGRKIVILDTGYNYNHPELGSSYGGGKDFVNNDNDPMDDHAGGSGSPGHGSHVAGIITADGIDGQAKGVAPQAQIIAGKVLNSQGSGDFAKIMTAIYWAINGPDNTYGTSDDFHPDAINLSVGADTYQNLCDNQDTTSREMAKAIKYARDHGTIVVVAAGNKAGGVAMPGCINDSFTVGAIDSANTIANFSGRGAGVDIVAPGTNIYSSLLGNNYGNKSGTSMATPIVSGIIALIKSAFPNYTVNQVEKAIIDTASDLGTSGKDTSYGWGRINATAAGTGATACSGKCGILTASPASCTKGSTPSNPNCNITLSYTLSGASPSTFIIKRDGVSLQNLTTANGSITDNNPTAGNYVYSLQDSNTGTIFSSVIVYVYYTGAFTSPWFACTKNANPANPNCDISLNYSLSGNLSGTAFIYKDGSSWKTASLPSGSAVDTNPAVGTHTYTIRDGKNQTQIERVVIRIEGAAKSRVINSLSSSVVRVGDTITITGTNVGAQLGGGVVYCTVQIHDQYRVRHTTLANTVNAANTQCTWTVNLPPGMNPGNYTLRVGPSLSPSDVSNEVNLTIN